MNRIYMPRFYVTRSIAYALVLLAASNVAAAADLTYPPANGYAVSRTVKYDDLNLNESADAKKLYRRLESMARTVCDARRAHDPEYIKAVIRPCLTTTVANAVKDVNAPLLTAYHRSQVGATLDKAQMADMQHRSTH